MSQEAGAKIIARFDPEDLHSGVHIYALSGEYMGFAECQQKVGFFDLEGARSTARRRSQITKAQKKLAELHAPFAPERLGADMNAGRKETPALMEAKVVSPVFPKPQPRVASSRPDPDAAAARDALVLQMKSKPKAKATPTEFQVAGTPDGRFDQVAEIRRKINAGEPVGDRERSWMEGFVDHPEYKGLLAVKRRFGGDTAG
jgi:hypothetical protein